MQNTTIYTCLTLSFLWCLIFQAKALAEKNERDMQTQRDQAERHVSVLIIGSFFSWRRGCSLELDILNYRIILFRPFPFFHLSYCSLNCCQRIAETLDIEIKRWAAGKEANLRALLSTLQYVGQYSCI